MRIQKIQLKNGYKRFKDLTIDLGASPSRIIALVGPNGNGKSSVFDGMLYAIRNWAIGEGHIHDVEYHSMEGDANFDNRMSENVIIKFQDGHTIASAIQKRISAGKGNTLFSFRSPYRYSSMLKVGQLSQIQDIKQNQKGAGATAHIDQKVTDNYQRLYSLIDRLYKTPGSSLTYEQAKGQVLGELNQSLSQVLDLQIVDHGDILSGRGTLYFSKSDQPKEFDFNVLSSGEKEVIDILIDIYVKREFFDDSIYIIDEPELHINTNIQRKLLNEIVTMIPENCQIWIATHSIGFLNALKQDHNDDSSIIWFQGKFAEEAAVLTPLAKTRTNWKVVFKTALEDLTGLIAPETMIYCEGRKEPDRGGIEQGLDAKVYNTIFEEAYPDVLFISSGGSTEPDLYSEVALKVLGKAFDDVNLVLLKDRDINGSGESTTQAQREEWINEAPTTRRMLERREIENYLFDPEILQKFKPDIDTDALAPLTTDMIDGDVKAHGLDIRRLCGEEQVNEDKFKMKLAELITPETSVYQELERVIFNP